ncbi:hypothetical protein TCAL_13617, partial [Tigriopus californicus]
SAEKRKFYYDRSCKPREVIPIGASVLVQNPVSKRWDATARVIGEPNGRQAVTISEEADFVAIMVSKVADSREATNFKEAEPRAALVFQKADSRATTNFKVADPAAIIIFKESDSRATTNSKVADPASIMVPKEKIGGKHYCILVDRFSNWPAVFPLRSLDTSTLLKHLQEWFLNWGIPTEIRSDGGPQFRSQFSEFCILNNIHHTSSSPYNPRSNGHAEFAVKQMKNLLSKSSTWNDFRERLREFRNTPNNSGFSPAHWVFFRPQKTTIPSHPNAFARISDINYEEAIKKKNYDHNKIVQYADMHSRELTPLKKGDRVVVQNIHSKLWNIKGVISSIQQNNRSYKVLTDGGRPLYRNQKFIKRS